MRFEEYLNEKPLVSDTDEMAQLAKVLSKGVEMLKIEYKKQRNDESNDVDELEKLMVKKLKSFEKLLK